jgi:hypothetical protein
MHPSPLFCGDSALLDDDQKRCRNSGIARKLVQKVFGGLIREVVAQLLPNRLAHRRRVDVAIDRTLKNQGVVDLVVDQSKFKLDGFWHNFSLAN